MNDEPHGPHVISRPDEPDHESFPHAPTSGSMRHRCRWCESEWTDSANERTPEHEDGCPVAELDEAAADARRNAAIHVSTRDALIRRSELLARLVDIYARGEFGPSAAVGNLFHAIQRELER